MSLRRRWRELARWWQSLWLPARVFLVVVPLLVAGLVVTLVIVLWPQPRPPEPPGDPAVYPVYHGQTGTPPVAASSGSPATLLHDDRLIYAPGWGTEEVRKFLESRPGTLGRMYIWVGDQEVPVADVITGQSLMYGVNPKVLLALIEFESALVDDPSPSPEALDLALGYPDPAARGLDAQIRWGVREILHGMRDYQAVNTLLLRDGRTVPVPEGANMGAYAVLRLVAQSGDEATLGRFQGFGDDSFVEIYRRLFGEDPRQPLENSPQPAAEPFLTKPYQGDFEVTSIFDHHYPFLSGDGLLLSSLGDEWPNLLDDGHNGWDYALDADVPILAAAAGTVIWAGNSNDGCATPALGVILDHGNGYRTLYWHLSQLNVEVGQHVVQQALLGRAGATGCSIGPHLHVDVRFLGRQVDPEGWCGTGADPWAQHPAGAGSAWLWADRMSPCFYPQGSILVDNAGPGFMPSGTDWNEGRGGVGGGAQWAASGARSGVVPIGEPGELNGVVEGGTWRPDLPVDGRYQVFAFIPYWSNGIDDSHAARYVIHHAGGETVVVVDQALNVDRWVDLGIYGFTAGRQGFVYLDNLTDEASFCVWFDAVLWVPAQ